MGSSTPLARRCQCIPAPDQQPRDEDQLARVRDEKDPRSVSERTTGCLNRRHTRNGLAWQASRPVTLPSTLAGDLIPDTTGG
jgi:hypothetical protein